MLKVKFKDELIAWTEFKSRLKEPIDDWKGLQFVVELPKKEKTSKVPNLSALQYKQLTSNRSELAEMRAEWQEFRKESVWLVNALFAAGGVGFCIFFVTYSHDFGTVIGIKNELIA